MCLGVHEEESISRLSAEVKAEAARIAITYSALLAPTINFNQGRFWPFLCTAALVVGWFVASPSSAAFPLGLPNPENADRITSLAKKFLPSIGTIMICNLSERRSAIIF